MMMTMNLNSEFSYKDKIVYKSAKMVVYREAVLLVPGIYCDSASKRLNYYPEGIIKEYGCNWESNYINVDHSKEVLKRIGKVVNVKFKDGKLVGDLQIYTITSVGKDIVSLIDSGLINWTSIEVDTIDKYNYDLEMMEVKHMTFVGVSIVTLPACKGAKIVFNGTDVSDYYYS